MKLAIAAAVSHAFIISSNLSGPRGWLANERNETLDLSLEGSNTLLCILQASLHSLLHTSVLHLIIINASSRSSSLLLFILLRALTRSALRFAVALAIGAGLVLGGSADLALDSSSDTRGARVLSRLA